MASPALVAALRRSREQWVTLEDGRRVKFMRPPESELGQLLETLPNDLDKDGKPRRVWAVNLEHVIKYAEDWQGFTEATFVGSAVGSSDPVPFDRDLWAEYVRDDVVLVRVMADAILKSVVDFLSQRDAVGKNSPPGSAPQDASAGDQSQT